MLLVILKTPLVFYSLCIYFLVVCFSLSFDSVESVWVLMEVTTFIFIGLSLLLTQGSTSGLSLISYFLTQSVFSLVLLMLSFWSHFSTNPAFLIPLLLILLFKLGTFPAQSWYFTSVLYLPTPSFLLALTFQKIAPLYILSLSLVTLSSDLTLLLSSLLLLSLLICSTSSLSSSDLRSVVVFTSVANNVWLFSAVLVSFTVLMVFMLIYSVSLLLLFYWSDQVKCVSLVSLSGLPPFPMFFLKLFIVYSLVSLTLFANLPIYLILLMVGTLLVSLSYVRLVVAILLSFSS